MKRRTIHGSLKAAIRALQRILDRQDKAARRFERALTPRRSNGRKAAVSKR